MFKHKYEALPVAASVDEKSTDEALPVAASVDERSKIALLAEVLGAIPFSLKLLQAYEDLPQNLDVALAEEFLPKPGDSLLRMSSTIVGSLVMITRVKKGPCTLEESILRTRMILLFDPTILPPGSQVFQILDLSTPKKESECSLIEKINKTKQSFVLESIFPGKIFIPITEDLNKTIVELKHVNATQEALRQCFDAFYLKNTRVYMPQSLFGFLLQKPKSSPHFVTPPSVQQQSEHLRSGPDAADIYRN